MKFWAFRVSAIGVWTMALVGLACEGSKPDVLQEFPPPRLARQTTPSTPLDAPRAAECEASWHWYGKSSRQIHHFPGSGSLQLASGATGPVHGEVTFETSGRDVPHEVQRALFERGGSAWTWRVLGRSGGQVAEDLADIAGNDTGLKANSELELNAVRTRQSHVIGIKLTKGGAVDDLQMETRLKIDLEAHRIRGLTLPDGSPPRRTELVVRCRLSSPLEGE